MYFILTPDHLHLPFSFVLPVRPCTLLSIDVTLACLAHSRESLERCERMAHISDTPMHATRLFSLVLSVLCGDFFDYALTIAAAKLPPSDSKTAPDTSYLDVAK